MQQSVIKYYKKAAAPIKPSLGGLFRGSFSVFRSFSAFLKLVRIMLET